MFLSWNLVQSMALALVKSVKAEKDEEVRKENSKVAEVSSWTTKGKRKEVSLHNVKLQGKGLSWWSGD